MKYIVLLAVALLIITLGGCALTSSAPRHSADEVTSIAKSLSPTCQKLIPPDPANCG